MSGEKIHPLSVYFILVYTITAAVSNGQDSLSECLFYFGIHPGYTHVRRRNDTLSECLFYVGIHLEYTHVAAPKY